MRLIVFQNFILFRFLGPNWPKSRNLANFAPKSGQKFVIFQKLSNNHFCIIFFYNLAKFHVSSSFLSKVNSKSVIQRYKILAVGVSRHRFLNSNISYKNADKLLKLGRNLEWNAVCLSIPNIVFQKFILFRYLGPNWPKSRNLANFAPKSGQKFAIF